MSEQAPAPKGPWYTDPMKSRIGIAAAVVIGLALSVMAHNGFPMILAIGGVVAILVGKSRWNKKNAPK